MFGCTTIGSQSLESTAMNQLLSTLIRNHFFVSSAIIKLMTEFILALIRVRDVNLTEIAMAICGSSDINSSYRKLQRFFAKAEICSECLAKFIVKLAGLEGKKWVLIMDRTNWKFGQIHINILTLSIECCGIGVPILWYMLDNKGGNSSGKQREDLITRFINIFGIKPIAYLLGDREFIGDEWLGFLADKGINFYIRIRSDVTINRAENELITANKLVKRLQVGEYIILPGQRHLGQNYKGPKVGIVACRNDQGDLVIIATNDNPERAMERYRKRWAIETLFGCLKTRGFNFENTHMVHLNRIEKLLALLAIAFTLCHIAGIWQNELKPIELKKHTRKAKSLFRYGMDYLRQILFLPQAFLTRFQQLTNHLITPSWYNLNQLILC